MGGDTWGPLRTQQPHFCPPDYTRRGRVTSSDGCPAESLDALKRARHPAGCPWAPASGTQSGDCGGKVGQGCIGPKEPQATCGPEPKLFSTVWETAWSPGKGTRPASGALMGIQALPLVGWVARVAETPPGSASPSRLSNISWCLPSRLTVGLGLSILEINTFHLTGLYRVGAEIQVKVGQIQSPPLSTVPHASSACTSPGDQHLSANRGAPRAWLEVQGPCWWLHAPGARASSARVSRRPVCAGSTHVQDMCVSRDCTCAGSTYVCRIYV